MSNDTYELLRLGLALLGGFAAMLWAALVLWVYRDSQARTEGSLPTVLATTLVGATFVVGWAVYLLLRPRQTLAEQYRRELADRELLVASGGGDLCQRCHTRVQPDFRVCPNCGLELKEPCEVCKRPVRSSWNLCPYCGHARNHNLRAQEPSLSGEREG